MRPTLRRHPEQRLTARLASDGVVSDGPSRSSSGGWDLFGERDGVADLAVAVLSSKNLEGSVMVVAGLLHGVMVSVTLNSVVSSFFNL